MSVSKSKGTLELMEAALNAQFNRYEISWENASGDVSCDVFDEFDELYLTIDEAVEQALAAIKALTAAHNAKIKRDRESKAAAVETKFPANNVKLNVERDMTPEAQAAHAAKAAAEAEVKAVAEAEAKAIAGAQAAHAAKAAAEAEAKATSETTAIADS